MMLPIKDFAGRFFQHILPKGFTKIRYHGFLSAYHKKEKLGLLKELLGIPGNGLNKTQHEGIEEERPAPECPSCGAKSVFRTSLVIEPTPVQDAPEIWDSS